MTDSIKSVCVAALTDTHNSELSTVSFFFFFSTDHNSELRGIIFATFLDILLPGSYAKKDAYTDAY